MKEEVFGLVFNLVLILFLVFCMHLEDEDSPASRLSFPLPTRVANRWLAEGKRDEEQAVILSLCPTGLQLHIGWTQITYLLEEYFGWLSCFLTELIICFL